jgi:hypothetical protein
LIASGILIYQAVMLLDKSENWLTWEEVALPEGT